MLRTMKQCHFPRSPVCSCTFVRSFILFVQEDKVAPELWHSIAQPLQRSPHGEQARLFGRFGDFGEMDPNAIQPSSSHLSNARTRTTSKQGRNSHHLFSVSCSRSTVRNCSSHAPAQRAHILLIFSGKEIRDKMGSCASAATATSGGISAEDRWRDIEQFASEYFQYLASSGGVVLSAEIRLQVAKMARQVLQCPGCASLPKDACIRKGVDIYKTIASLDTHSTQDSKTNVLLHLVHSVLNHQGRLTESWYHSTLERLDECGWVDPATAPRGAKKRTYLLYSLFSEIVLVATMVHCFDIVFIVANQEMPDLPEASPHATPPTGFDWSLALRPGKSPTTKGCWAPYLTASDVDPKSPPLQSLSDETRKNQLDVAMSGDGPYVAVTWSVDDMVWLLRMFPLLYVDRQEVIATYRPLSAEKRCADSFSRRDVELIASEVAKAYDCAF